MPSQCGCKDKTEINDAVKNENLVCCGQGLKGELAVQLACLDIFSQMFNLWQEV